ncbi:MAG: hypothetical protein CVU81_02400 [Euryarchaeota archaeon HGW-Euryarchaeota-1]|nr:MAG: hypothetical protein CVU81_02400 [Euryarchaeota archaeon HGW-Euryarchaeota-1]
MKNRRWLEPNEKIIKKCRWAAGGDPFVLVVQKGKRTPAAAHTKIFALFFHYLLRILYIAKEQKKEIIKTDVLFKQAGYNVLNLYLTNKRLYAEFMFSHECLANIPFSKIKEFRAGTKDPVVFRSKIKNYPVIIYDNEEYGELEFCFMTH